MTNILSVSVRYFIDYNIIKKLNLCYQSVTILLKSVYYLGRSIIDTISLTSKKWIPIISVSSITYFMKYLFLHSLFSLSPMATAKKSITN
jgi:hypothetical protein